MAFETLTKNIEYLTDWRVVGNSCSVYKDGKQVYTHASGYSDRENGILMTVAGIVQQNKRTRISSAPG